MAGVQTLTSLFPVPLKAANNLSDLASVTAALTALGLGTTAAAELARIGAASLTDWRQGLIEMCKTRTWAGQIGAFADGFFDQSNVDVANSVNATYSSSGMYYSNPDPYTKLLMHFDATPFTDDVGHSVTVSGSPAANTSTTKFGAASLYLNGSSYLTIQQTGSESNFPQNGSWTIEHWLYVSSIPSSQVEVWSTNGFHLFFKNSTLNFDNGTTTLIAASTAPSAGSWNKIEIVSNAGQITMYLNGSSVGSASAQAWAAGSQIWLGCYQGSSSNTGAFYMDEFRVSQGIARHTATYTPETAPFTFQPAALDLRSAALALPSVPTKGSIFVIVNPLNGVTITPQTNLIVSISQNGTAGTITWTQVTLTLSGTTTKGYFIYEANGVTLSGTGQALKTRVQTTAGTGIQVLGVYAKVL